MFISQELRKKSIAEYVLYMWQVEDLIRAYGCSLSRIKNEYVSRFADYTDEQREELTDWYGDLIRMINHSLVFIQIKYILEVVINGYIQYMRF